MTTGEGQRPLACPECGAMVDTAQGLGAHRRYRHGITGQRPRTVAQRDQSDDTDQPEAGD